MSGFLELNFQWARPHPRINFFYMVFSSLTFSPRFRISLSFFFSYYIPFIKWAKSRHLPLTLVNLQLSFLSTQSAFSPQGRFPLSSFTDGLKAMWLGKELACVEGLLGTVLL